ncbi:MAG TPA: RMD1 family protein [Polyangia bacterium]|nr:RMD1 family protein [Polyangia bacterium]
MPTTIEHVFHAVAFVENIALKEVAPMFDGAKRSGYELALQLGANASAFIYPFGAMVFHNVAPAARNEMLERLRKARPGLTTVVIQEDFTVREDPGRAPEFDNGTLTIDRMTPERAGVVALIVGQSASMEYYENIVEQMFTRTGLLVDRLEKAGTVSLRTRPLHRFIGEAVSTRSEVLSVLHLLDKPDATWDDPVMNEIYDDLRAEFDLLDRYGALESKLRSVQEALELVLDVARDRRLVLLESTVVLLIVLEVALSLLR